MQSNKTGAALKAIRLAAGMTLQQVADTAGVSLSYLSRVETGQATATDGWISCVAVAIGEHLADAA